MRRTLDILLASLVVSTIVLAAQPLTRGQRHTLEARVRALEARVASLERRIERSRPPTVTGELDGLPRQVVEAVAWAHPKAEITDTDRDQDLQGRIVWTVELTSADIEWVMLITPDGRVLDDRVDD